LYTGRGPVCGMIMRGDGAIGVVGLTGAALCICMTLDGGGAAAGGTLAVAETGAVGRGGTAIAGGAALVGAAGGVAAVGVTGAFGGITTTDGGRYVAATEAGVTILGAGGVAGTSVAGFGATAFGGAGTIGASAFASTDGVAVGGLIAGRAAGCSVAPFCCVMARSTSPGREICERSILVLKSSSP
jgi:hypothetical protein